ncbi:ATP-grasp domain-containing protein [Candidatus Woesearchaeota archaeon]|nr:ATP-grasp domain-containing protein [Candidatus Woesearchaeota archaeon]
MNNIVYNSVNFKTNKPKMFVIAASPYSVENFNELYSDFEIGVITSFFQKSLPPNTIVINPDLKKDISKRFIVQNNFEQPYLISKLASEDEGLKKIIDTVLLNDSVVYMKPLTMNQGMQFENPRIITLAPSFESVNYFDNKLENKKLLNGKVPLNNPVITSKDELSDVVKRLDKGAGVAVAVELGGGGTGIKRIQNQNQLKNWIKEKGDVPYIVETWLDDASSLSTYSIVDIFGNVLSGPISEMVLRNQTSWCGTGYNNQKQSFSEDFKTYLDIIGGELKNNKLPYLGMWGTDFLKNNSIYFIEINPRSGGTSLEVALHMDKLNPERKKFMDVEAQALLGNQIDTNYLVDSDDFVWKKQVYKLPHAVKIVGDFPVKSKKDSFNDLEGGIFGVHEKGTIIPAEEPICNILSIAENEINRSIQEINLTNMVKSYIKKV